jgi:hypothetical protein
MHLKLRRKRPRAPHPDVLEVLRCRCNPLIYRYLAKGHTNARRRQGLAADVHLFSADKYGESVQLCTKKF